MPYSVAARRRVASTRRAAAIFRRRAASLTRGVVEIFRHDWSLDSNLAREELGLTTTALEDGLGRTLASLR